MNTHKNIRIILMVSAPLTTRWASYYCTDSLASVFTFEYWDCSAVVGHPFAASEILLREYVHVIRNYDDLKNQLSLLPNDTVIVEEIPFRKENTPFHKLVSAKFKSIVHFDFFDYDIIGVRNNAIVNTDTQTNASWGKKIKSFFYKNDYVKLFVKLVFHGIAEFQRQLILLKGERKRQRIFRENNFTRYKRIYHFANNPHCEYPIHHPDYEKYRLIEASQKKIVSGKYIVFIDQYFPYHPDLQMSEPDVDYPSLAEPYFQSLNHFFEGIENEMQMPVVIAAHPSAHYENNPYDGRFIFYFKTAELIKDSEAICMHSSNALNFVALWDKPLALLNNKSVEVVKSLNKYDWDFANALDMTLYDTDEVQPSTEIFEKIDRNLRRDFVNGLAIPSLKNKSNAELITKYIVEVHEKLLSRK